ncbi:zinc-binding dehydrogenase [Microlunatus parietis]|uniref:NADPH2:quinone reductase n=1 Tax=Microlunatus parietis TaxID=682979 RepID=A0A7Y9I5C1_9ACTN|nr:zinc-binding dehydrogenase [Microlunatus parietis]NYE69994.1 NADPH2:quinone reductase [Microlunatus parietis]
MRAIRLHAFGPPENLVLDDLPDLEPGPGEVRIAVEASGVHLLDTALRRGEGAGPMATPSLPTVPGREVAGRIDRIGADVPQRWLGRRVVAHLGMVPGGYAEQAVTTIAKLYDLDALPGPVTGAEAVALVGTGRTTVGVLSAAALTASDTVLIPAAAGGIGWLLVQAARAAGAAVIAAAGGEEKVRRLAELGPDEVVDYSRPDWPDRVRKSPTVVLDGVGGAIGRAAFDLLAPGGRLLMFGWSSGTATQITTDDLVGRSLTASWGFGFLPGGDLDRLRPYVEEALQRAARAEWRPLLTMYPLADAARAHTDLEHRRTVGKVVLT